MQSTEPAAPVFLVAEADSLVAEDLCEAIRARVAGARILVLPPDAAGLMQRIAQLGPIRAAILSLPRRVVEKCGLGDLIAARGGLVVILGEAERGGEEDAERSGADSAAPEVGGAGEGIAAPPSGWLCADRPFSSDDLVAAILGALQLAGFSDPPDAGCANRPRCR